MSPKVLNEKIKNELLLFCQAILDFVAEFYQKRGMEVPPLEASLTHVP